MKYAPPLMLALGIVSAMVFYGGLLRPVFALPAMTAAAVAAVLAGGWALWQRGRTPPLALPVSLCAALAAWMLFRISASPATTEADAMARLVLGCAAAFLCMASGGADPRGRLAFFVVIWFAAMIQAGVGAYQFVFRVPEMPLGWFSEQLRLWYEGRSDGTRAHGFYINGNHLAWLLNTASLSALAAACWARWPAWARILALYFAGVALAGALPTLSRGGFVSLAAGFCVFLVASAVVLAAGSGGRRLGAALTVAGGAVVAVAAIWFVYSESPRVQMRAESLTDDSYRPIVLQAALRQFQLDPLYGQGPASFAGYARSFRIFTTGNDDIFAHNDWVQIAAEYGYPAFALAALLVLALFLGGFQSLAGTLSRRMAESGWVSSNAVAVHIAALSTLTAHAVHSAFDFNLQLPANALLAAACAGMLANPGATPRHLPLPRRLAAIATALLAIAAGLGTAQRVLRDSPRETAHLQIENLLLSGRVPEAIQAASARLERDPSDRQTTLLRAQAVLAQPTNPDNQAIYTNEAFQTAQDLIAAARIQPLDAFGELALATALGRLDAYQPAAEAAARAVALYPIHQGGYQLLGMALEAQGRSVEALGLYAAGSALPDPKSTLERFNRLRDALKAPQAPRQ